MCNSWNLLLEDITETRAKKKGICIKNVAVFITKLRDLISNCQPKTKFVRMLLVAPKHRSSQELPLKALLIHGRV